MTAARVRLGALTAVLLVAGILPWATGGPTVTRVLGVPFLLLGLLAGYATTRLPAVASRATIRTAPPAGCAGCNCGAGACAQAAAGASAGSDQADERSSP
ncbi:MAG TPA: hypothetical protein VGH85_01715 [Mycobacteriales bacterium]